MRLVQSYRAQHFILMNSVALSSQNSQSNRGLSYHMESLTLIDFLKTYSLLVALLAIRNLDPKKLCKVKTP